MEEMGGAVRLGEDGLGGRGNRRRGTWREELGGNRLGGEPNSKIFRE